MTEEILYPAMEDFRLDITVGKGSTAKIRSIPLPKFTLVGDVNEPTFVVAPTRVNFGSGILRILPSNLYPP